MRIVIDVQLLQLDSQFKEIKKYTIGLVQNIIKNREIHEIYLIYDGNKKETVQQIKSLFRTLPASRFIPYFAPVTNHCTAHEAELNRKDSEIIYQYAVLQYRPDFYLTASLFLGIEENFTIGMEILKKYCKIGCIVYDFLPLKSQEISLKNNPAEQCCSLQLKQLELFDIVFTMSQFTAKKYKELIPHLSQIVISPAVDELFQYTEEKPKILNNVNKKFIFFDGEVSDRKNVDQLIKAFSLLDPKLRSEYQLVIACGNYDDLQEKLSIICESYNLSHEEYQLLSYITDEELCKLYSHCSLVVFSSFEESLGLSVLEAIKCGAAVICSETVPLQEILEYEKSYFDPNSAESISRKIQRTLTDPYFYAELKEHCRKQAKKFSWDNTTNILLNFNGITREVRPFISSDKKTLISVCRELAKIKHTSIQRLQLAHVLNNTFITYRHHFFIDITILAENDAKTGIERVTKELMKNLLLSPPHGWKVIPVTVQLDGIHYAYDCLRRLGLIKHNKEDEIVMPIEGDILFCPELSLDFVHLKSGIMEQLHEKGVKIYTVIYALIAIFFPQYCFEAVVNNLPSFLHLTAQFDGIIAISQTTRDDYAKWLKHNCPAIKKDFLLGYFHLGCDFSSNMELTRESEESSALITLRKNELYFLIVSTIEPRKGHALTLDAFEELWNKGLKVNLLLAGKQGWNVEKLCGRIQTHPQLNNRLFWFKGISDSSLKQLYKISAAVIMPSEAEGFGLALVEGAYFGKPLILRDIPVFREIAGNAAWYFCGSSKQEVSDKILEWIELYKNGIEPKSENIKLLSWSESTRMLLKQLPL